ncbi:hypothetical protein GGR57DRAFT_501833 [Xylariaceae sp. FL1272]|nr:hypothetical protein GGR57DRAFT_501833 [Xylariaceae sp. FL1272]
MMEEEELRKNFGHWQQAEERLRKAQDEYFKQYATLSSCQTKVLEQAERSRGEANWSSPAKWECTQQPHIGDFEGPISHSTPSVSVDQSMDTPDEVPSLQFVPESSPSEEPVCLVHPVDPPYKHDTPAPHSSEQSITHGNSPNRTALGNITAYPLQTFILDNSRENDDRSTTIDQTSSPLPKQPKPKSKAGWPRKNTLKANKRSNEKKIRQCLPAELPNVQPPSFVTKHVASPLITFGEVTEKNYWIITYKLEPGAAAFYILHCPNSKCLSPVFSKHPFRKHRAVDHLAQCGVAFKDEDDILCRYARPVISGTKGARITRYALARHNRTLLSQSEEDLSGENIEIYEYRHPSTYDARKHSAYELRDERSKNVNFVHVWFVL